MQKIIVIDGPAGCGKSSVASLVAQRLGLRKLDTGAIYRSLALAAIKAGASLSDEAALTELAETLPLEFKGENVLLGGADVSEEIRTPGISKTASVVSAFPAVRSALLPVQRKIAASFPCVAEGRDLGTVVFPDAAVKLFLTASEEERAMRRYKQLKEKGVETTYEQALKDERERDERDSSRAAAPLKKADDAIEIDTTKMTIEQVVDKIVEIAKTHGF